jgi:hypothetical protein
MKRFTVVAMMSIALLLITSMAFGQVSSFPYSTTFETDNIGAGNWTTSRVGTTQPLWVDGTTTAAGDGDNFYVTAVGANSATQPVSTSLFVTLNTSGMTFSGGESFQFRYTNSAGTTRFTLTIWESATNTQLGTISLASAQTEYATKIVDLISAMENQSSVTIEIRLTRTSTSNGQNTTIKVDNAQIYGGALPVQMVSFTAASNRLDASLRWSTATETNNYGFEIERRNVGASEWSKVGFVRGAGTSTSPRDYSYVDAGLAPGRYAYRVKQIDSDGSSAYAGNAEVEVGVASKVLALEPNYPNPFNPSTQIQFTVPENGHVTLKVYNMVGQEVATLFNQVAEAGRIQQVSFDASQLPTGMYFSRLEYGNQQVVRKMLFVK